MTSDFFQWKVYKAQQILLKFTNRLLSDVVSIKTERGKYILLTKSYFSGEKYTTLIM